MLGSDGYPVPEVQRKNSYKVTCPICVSGDANMSVSKKGNWIVRCGTCSIILYLNSLQSINLFRGFQKVINDNPEYQVSHTQLIVENAPDIGQ
jgi:hypothetical protein